MNRTRLKQNNRIPRPLIGWPLLPVPQEGTLVYPSLAASIRQQIKVLLLTRPGEQLMRPTFGAGLADFRHQPNTIETRQRVQDSVVDALERWERRIEVDRVSLREGDQADILQIEIVYRIKRTGERTTTMVTLTIGS